MNREILFRGKRMDNGEWVEGYLVVKNDPLLVDVTYYFILSYHDKDSFVTWYKVDPTTVGQYTGLTDRNGTKIFEGAIVKTESEGRTICGEVVFGMFGDRYIKVDTLILKWHRGGGLRRDLRYWAGKVDVIGNVYDNPELLSTSSNPNSIATNLRLTCD